MSQSPERPFSWRAYLALNLIVWAFGAGIFIVALRMNRDTYGMLCMALALPLTFTAVSIADALFGRIVRRNKGD